MSDSLARRTLGNMGLTGFARGVTMLLQMVANVVLARELTSSDYGIVGFAQVFITLLTMLSEFGLNSAAIQRERLGESELDTGFTLRLLLGLAAFAAALLLAPLSAAILSDAAVADVVKLLAVGFLVNALAFVPGVRLLRALDYRRYIKAQILGAVVNTTVTVILAWNGFAYWSIVIANLAATATITIALMAMVRHRPRLVLQRDSVSHYAGFGGHVFLAWLLTFVIMNLDRFVIGSLAGPVTLGFYALAYTWGAKFCELLGTVVNSVLFPTFSRMQADTVRLRAAYLKSLQLVGFLAAGGYAAFYLVSADFVHAVLGEGSGKWQASLATLQILCVYGLVRALLEPVGSVVMALGGPAVLVRANGLAAALKAALIYPALIHFGIEGVAVLVTLSYASQLFVFLPALRQRLQVHVGDLCRVTALPLLSAALALGLGEIVLGFSGVAPGWPRLIAGCLVFSSAYLLTFGLLSRGAAYREFLGLLGWAGKARDGAGS